MSYSGALFRRTCHFLTVSLVAIFLLVSMAPKALSQQFSFIVGAGFASPSLFTSITLTLSQYAVSGSTTAYDVDDLSGTFNGLSMSLLSPATVGMTTVNNRVYAEFDSITLGDLSSSSGFDVSSGFGFSAGGTDYFVARDAAGSTPNGSSNNLFVFSSSTGPALNGTAGVFSNPVAVPGPLAGAGVLSYLAVILMGIVFRGRWLVAQTRVWLERRRAPQLVQES